MLQPLVFADSPPDPRSGGRLVASFANPLIVSCIGLPYHTEIGDLNRLLPRFGSTDGDHKIDRSRARG
jgi:hypothetical protein